MIWFHVFPCDTFCIIVNFYVKRQIHKRTIEIGPSVGFANLLFVILDKK